MIDLNHSRNMAVLPRAGCFHILLVLPVLTFAFGLIPAGRMAAQTFKTLHSFTGTSDPYGTGTNTDGVNPNGLILSGNTLYGTALGGGSNGNGTVYTINTDGTGFKTLHSFTATAYQGYYQYTNSDGAAPNSLILSDNALYGTSSKGGSSGNGTVFAINTDGTGFKTIHSFTATDTNSANSDGAFPTGLILAGKTLYGNAGLGGSGGGGTVFAVNTDATGFTVLHTFSGGSFGANLNGPLVLSGNVLYGTSGDLEGYGTVFAVNTDGTGFNSFPIPSGLGLGPFSGLTLSGNRLYGTSAFGSDAIFAVNTDGTGFTMLHTFAGRGQPPPYLLLSGNTLYGTTRGTVFAVNTDGAGFTTLYSFSLIQFSTNSDGAFPVGGLILSGNTLYGTASEGGSSGFGTVFSLSVPPQLAIIPTKANIILMWPTNATGFALQSATNLISPVWTTNSPAPVVVNRENTVTNPISSTQQFFRLSNE
jgi:uncharacterized repeat protein (TIGR03803 family)